MYVKSQSQHITEQGLAFSDPSSVETTGCTHSKDRNLAPTPCKIVTVCILMQIHIRRLKFSKYFQLLKEVERTVQPWQESATPVLLTRQCLVKFSFFYYMCFTHMKMHPPCVCSGGAGLCLSICPTSVQQQLAGGGHAARPSDTDLGKGGGGLIV